MFNFSREKSFEAIVKTAIDAVVVMDSNNTIRYANPGATSLLGWSNEELIGNDMGMIMPERFREMHRKGMQRYLDTKMPVVLGTPFVFLPSLHKDGHEIPTNISIATWDEGEQTFFTGIIRDISATIEHQERQDLLIKELNHRVKNTLAVITGMVRQTAKQTNDVEAYQATLEERIFAMSKTHDLLVDTNWKHTTLDALLKCFVDPAGFPYFYDGPDDVFIKPNIAIAIGMALNELVTNCIKYGAWSDGGHVLITGDRKDGKSIFVWKERGGPKVSEPAKKNFGSVLLERVVASAIQGSAKMYFEPDGLRYEVIGLTPVMGD